MRRIGITGFAFAVAVAINALATAGAWAASLRLEAGGQPLAAGAPLTASSSNFALTYKNHHEAKDTLRCTQSTVSGTLERNGQPSDIASLTESAFTGCSSHLGFEVRATFAKVTLEHGGTALIGEPIFELQRVGAKAICSFRGRLPRGHFPVNGEPMAVTFARGHLKDDSIGPFCPVGATWSATFNNTSGGLQVMAFGG